LLLAETDSGSTQVDSEGTIIICEEFSVNRTDEMTVFLKLLGVHFGVEGRPDG
jgi:hypothetical protein